MNEILVAVIYVFGFLNMVIPACLSPSNWDSCRQIDAWLIPEVQEALKRDIIGE